MRSGGDLGLRMHGVCFPAMVFWFRWGRECERGGMRGRHTNVDKGECVFYAVKSVRFVGVKRL